MSGRIKSIRTRGAGESKKKHRPGNKARAPKKKFDLEKRNPFVWSSGIKVFKGEAGEAFGMRVCPTVVIQKKSKRVPRGLKREGRRRPPLSVMWHILPDHINDYEGNLRLVRKKTARQVEALKREEVQERLKERFIKSLESRGEHSKEKTELMMPEKVVQGIIDYVEKQGGGGSISVTVFPALETFDKGSKHHETTKAAFYKTKRLFEREKKAGRINSIRTRGASGFAETEGSSSVYLDTNGRLYRSSMYHENG